MFKRNLIISLIIVALSIILRMIVYFSNSQFSLLGVFQNVISLFLLLPAVFFAIKLERDHHPFKIIDFKVALKTGLLVSVLTGVGIGLFLVLYFDFIDTAFVNTLIDKTKAIAVEKNIEEQRMMDEIAKIREAFNGFHQATTTIMYSLVTGLIFSLICAGFLVRTANTENTTLN